MLELLECIWFEITEQGLLEAYVKTVAVHLWYVMLDQYTSILPLKMAFQQFWLVLTVLFHF